jgi:chromosome segregation ATPase
MHAAFDNPNDFSDDYEQFQEIIFNHFKSKKERGDKIYIPQIMKLLSGEIECPNDDIVKEIEAERVSAMNDRDSLYSRLEILDEQLIKTDGQVALRDHELQNLRQEVLQLKEMVRGFESHQVLHELSVQQHCTELVTDLSRCREDLMNYLDQRNHLHELRSEKEDAMGLQECRRKLEVESYSFFPTLINHFSSVGRRG